MADKLLSSLDNAILFVDREMFNNCSHKVIPDEWHCASIGRISFSLDLWKAFKLNVKTNHQEKMNFIFMLKFLFEPFCLEDMLKDFIHVQKEHQSVEDLNYINNGITMPVCTDDCLINTEFKMSDDRLKESEIIEYFLMIHSYFSHQQQQSNTLTQVSSNKNTQITQQKNNSNNQKTNFIDKDQVKSILKSQTADNLKALFYGLKRKLIYKDTQEICNAFLEILADKIDSRHTDISLSNLIDVLENKYLLNKKQYTLSICNGTLRPNVTTQCDEPCNNYWQCSSFKAVLFMMKLYNKQIQEFENNKNNINADSDSEIEQDIGMNASILTTFMFSDGYCLTNFLNDFHHIQNNHLLKNITSWKRVNLELNNANCKSSSKCYSYQRHLRDRRKYDSDLTERRKIYNNQYKSEDVVPYQIFDGVHHFLIHWDYKKYLSPSVEKVYCHSMNSKILKADIKCDTEDITIRKRENRFVTELTELKFEYGYPFYHWKAYKDREGYVDPKLYKYSNLKNEMLHNVICSINKIQWNDSITKAIIHKYSANGRKLKSIDRGDFNFNRAIPKDLMIPLPHLMVILIYTNYDKPQYEFKKKGMRTTDKNIHCEIAYFYKIFAETILFYGQRTQERDKNGNEILFYHGINTDKLFFSEFHPNFNAPISTTCIPANAYNFCGVNGMLLVLKPDKTISDTFFDCWCSDHFEEREYLFAEAHHLFIKDIKLQRDNLMCSCEQYILSMSLFQDILDGVYFGYSMPKWKQHEQNICQLIQGNKTIPKYVQSNFNFLFQHCKQKKSQILMSEYIQLEMNTRAAIENHFTFDQSTFIDEFEWNVKELNSDDMKIDQLIESDVRSFQNKFSFSMYLKLKSRSLSPKVSVGIWIKNISLKVKEVSIEWGFKCNETEFCLSKLREVLQEHKQDAYKAFFASELQQKSIKKLNFTFYVKLFQKK